MLQRLDPALAIRQSAWISVAFLARAVIPRRFYQAVLSSGGWRWCGAAAVVLQLTVFLVGTEKHGAKNWVMLGPFSTQPGEFSKLFLILFLAGLFRHYRNWLRVDIAVPTYRLPHPSLFALVGVWSAVEVAFVAQKDLGMALLTGVVFLTMLFVATGRKDVIGVCLLLGAVGSAAAYALYPHVRQRFVAWLEPFSDPLGTGYQSVQAMYALASGGLWGRGLGRGEPGLIPEAATDFITAALCEEFGLVGFVAILLLLVLLVARAYLLAVHSTQEQGVFVLFGLATSFAVQVFLVTGGCLRLIPLTGLTLPFLSYGGSSMLSSVLCLTLIERCFHSGDSNREEA